jgi:hypothetical protein
VARILNPIVLTLEKLEDLQDIEGLGEYVQGTFGGVEQCRKDILRKFFFSLQKAKGGFSLRLHFSDYLTVAAVTIFPVDFFRSAFDGSGADNFFDAGSCIDGRLTSAWNCKHPRVKYNFAILTLYID